MPVWTTLLCRQFHVKTYEACRNKTYKTRPTVNFGYKVRLTSTRLAHNDWCIQVGGSETIGKMNNQSASYEATQWLKKASPGYSKPILWFKANFSRHTFLWESRKYCSVAIPWKPLPLQKARYYHISNRHCQAKLNVHHSMKLTFFDSVPNPEIHSHTLSFRSNFKPLVPLVTLWRHWWPSRSISKPLEGLVSLWRIFTPLRTSPSLCRN